MLLESAEDTDAQLARFTEEADDLASVRLTLDILLHVDIEQGVRLRYTRVPVQLDTLPAHHLAAKRNGHNLITAVVS